MIDTTISYRLHNLAQQGLNMSQLLSIMKSREDKTKLEPVEVQYNCSMCDKNFQSEHYWQLHVINKVCTEVTKHFCDSCPYSTGCKSNLFRHIKSHHPNKVRPKVTKRHSINKVCTKFPKHFCNTCPYSTGCKSNLTRHIERNHMKKPKPQSYVSKKRDLCNPGEI